MAQRTRRDLEVTLLEFVVSSLQSRRQTRHLFSAQLIWPRVNIASRNCEKELKLEHGRVDWQQAEWEQKILFKETVDNIFGLELRLSCVLSQAQLQEFSRYLAGNISKIAAKTLDDIIPVGDVAVLPLLYASKNLLQTSKPEIIVRASCSVDLNDIPEEGQILELPLLSQRELVKRRREGGHRDHIRYLSEKTLEIGAPDGWARIQLRLL
jgi:hypothetical protein